VVTAQFNADKRLNFVFFFFRVVQRTIYQYNCFSYGTGTGTHHRLESSSLASFGVIVAWSVSGSSS